MEKFRYEATSELVIEKLRFEWTVQNFSLCKLRLRECLESPELPVKRNDQITWKIKIFPCGNSYKDYVALYLEPVFNVLPEKVFAKFKFELFNSKNQQIPAYDKSMDKLFSPDQGDWGITEFILRDKLLGSLSDSNLKIVCKLEVHKNAQNDSLEPDLHPQSSIITDLDTILKDGALSDVTISVQGTQFNAHKLILAMRSPVFRSMFSNEMIEAKSNKVEIPDIKPEIFSEFLKYVYTGYVDAANIAGELLSVAEKYCVEDLKGLCEFVLCKNMKLENCIENLILSNLYSAEKLKRETVNFILNSGPGLTLANGWAELNNKESMYFPIVEAYIHQAPVKIVTDIPIMKLTFIWNIVNISFAWENEFITSPDFYENEKEKWAIKIKTKNKKDNKLNVSIFLELRTSYRKEVKAKFNFSLQNTEGKEIASFVCDTFKTFNSEECKMEGKENLISTEDIFSKLDDDTLKIVCTLDIMKETNLKTDFL